MNKYHTYDFLDCKCLVVCGDIHGDFNLLVNKICVQYQMKDTLVIVAGDCGFGFERKRYYENIVRRNAKRMNESNNWLLQQFLLSKRKRVQMPDCKRTLVYVSIIKYTRYMLSCDGDTPYCCLKIRLK